MQARRATVEDLEQLREIWKGAELPGMELEKRFTEFQVAEDDLGKIVGAVGFHIDKKQGLIHNEAFSIEGPGAVIWPVFWERIQTIAKNNGLLRLWTKSKASIFQEKGFQTPDSETLKKMPATFGEPGPGLLTLKLKDELPAVSVEHEFKLFAESSREETERMMKQAQIFKVLAYILLIFFSIGAIALGAIAFLKTPRRRR